MNEIFSKTFTVSSTETDLNDQMRPAAVLSRFQELGTQHASILNMDRDYLVRNYHACWLLARVWYQLYRPLHEGEEVTVHTWCRGAGGLIVYRDYDIYVGEEYVGEGVAAWVIADLDTRTMLRPGSVENIAIYEPPKSVKEKQLRLIRTPKERVKIYDRTVRLSDLDINGHMNNTKYADVILDAFTPGEFENTFISQFQLNYSQECRYGETVELSRGNDDNGCYVDGCCEDGKRRFEAHIQLLPVAGNQS